MRAGLLLGRRLAGAAEADGMADAWPLELPRVAARQPVLGALFLPAILDGLPEQAEIVTDAIALGRHFERGHAFHETGRQPPQAAIAQRGVGLGLAQQVEIGAQHVQGLARGVDQSQVAEHVEQLPADQELQRQVVDALAVALARLAPHIDPFRCDAVAQRQGRGHVPVMRRGALRLLACGFGQLRRDRRGQGSGAFQ